MEKRTDLPTRIRRLCVLADPSAAYSETAKYPLWPGWVRAQRRFVFSTLTIEKDSIMATKRPQRPASKRIEAIGKNEERICPTCLVWTAGIVTRDGVGWEHWTCGANGCYRAYRVLGGLS